MNNQLVQRDQQGAERCRRVKRGVVQRDKNNPAAGFIATDVYCNKPMLMSIAEKRKLCPDCDKPPVVGNPQPRVTNAAGVTLTKKELEECGVQDGVDPSTVPQETKPIEAAIAVEAKVSEVKKDAVVLTVPLAELEGDIDVAAYLIRKVIEGFGTLPTPTYAESKRVMKLETKLEGLLGA